MVVVVRCGVKVVVDLWYWCGSCGIRSYVVVVMIVAGVW